MPFEFFDFDPLTGVREDLAFEDGKVHIRYTQDVEPVINKMKALKNEGMADETWRKTGATLYASIPAVVQGALLKKGINFLDSNDMPRLLDEINTNYPWLKATNKTHRLK